MRLHSGVVLTLWSLCFVVCFVLDLYLVWFGLGFYAVLV